VANTPSAPARSSLSSLEVGSALSGPACLGAAGFAAVLAGPLTPAAGLVGAGGSVAMGGSLLYGLAAVRSRGRAALVEALGPGLAHLIGPPDQTLIRARRWRSGFIGAPTRIRIRYAPSARAHEKEWADQVRMVAAARLGNRLKVEKHDQRARELHLVAIESAALTPEQDADRERAERNITRLLGPTAKVVDVEVVDGQVQRIRATFEEATRFATSGHRARIERALTEVMPGRWRGIWLLQKDQVTFEQRPPLPDCIWVPPPPSVDSAHLLENYGQVAVEFARSEDGNPISWRPARIPQGLIIGGTGSGKTSTSHAIVSGFTRHGWPVWISDAKRVEFLAFRDYPNVQLVATGLEQQVAMIWNVVLLMEYRYKLIESGQARVQDFEPLLVVLDEFTEQRDELLDWYPSVKGKIKDTKPPTLKHVGRIARKARTARIHLLVLLQRPDAAFLSGEALALDTPIPTPGGWTTMGEIQEGDFVYDHTGAPTVVTRVTEVAHGRPCYRVTFSDGSTLLTDANHRWLAHSATRRASLASRYVPLTRQQRWPHHAGLAEALSDLDLDDDRELTVAEFEAALGPGRNALLRRILTPARAQVAAVGTRPSAGRFTARTYLAGDLKRALTQEIAAAPRTGRPRGGQIVTTEQMAQSLTSAHGDTNWSVDVAGPIQAPPAELPIDPWLLGYWLGDGHKDSATIATADEEVVERIRSLGYRVTHYGRFNYGISTGTRGGRGGRPTLIGALRGLGLLGNKHIPIQYLRASIAQREALLAGLLDSDGTCAVRGKHHSSGQVVFTNVDPRLVDGVAQLAASLGLIPTVRQVRSAGTESHPSSVAYGRATRAAFAVSFTPARQVFSLSRKQAALEPSLRSPRRATTTRRYVVSVEPVASVPVRCIAVAAPDHLYLAGERFIPTHNTRDNFGMRVSMGRLSPSGALMMWENSAIGVTLPRYQTGRCMATDDSGRVVEAQAYRFPDMDAAPGSEEGRLLAQLRPRQSRHERLLVTPVRELVDDVSEATFWDYANAPLVRASERPDLDPLVVPETGGPQLDPALVASPIILLDRSALAALDDGVAGTRPVFVDPGTVDVAQEGFDKEYFEPEEVVAERLEVGDLVLVDPDLDQWGVVDQEVEESSNDPDLVEIAWRGHAGEEGLLTLGAGEALSRRRPRLEVLGEPLPQDD